jgi:hypothetical protein
VELTGIGTHHPRICSCHQHLANPITLGEGNKMPGEFISGAFFNTCPGRPGNTAPKQPIRNVSGGIQT